MGRFGHEGLRLPSICQLVGDIKITISPACGPAKSQACAILKSACQQLDIADCAKVAIRFSHSDIGRAHILNVKLLRGTLLSSIRSCPLRRERLPAKNRPTKAGSPQGAGSCSIRMRSKPVPEPSLIFHPSLRSSDTLS